MDFGTIKPHEVGLLYCPFVMMGCICTKTFYLSVESLNFLVEQDDQVIRTHVAPLLRQDQ